MARLHPGVIRLALIGRNLPGQPKVQFWGPAHPVEWTVDRDGATVIDRTVVLDRPPDQDDYDPGWALFRRAGDAEPRSVSTAGEPDVDRFTVTVRSPWYLVGDPVDG